MLTMMSFNHIEFMLLLITKNRVPVLKNTTHKSLYLSFIFYQLKVYYLFFSVLSLQSNLSFRVGGIYRAKRLSAKPYRTKRLFYSSGCHSKISPGWQSSSLHIASSVLKRIALAFPVFSIERLAGVISTFSESSLRDIFRFAIMTSKFTIMGIVRFGIYDLGFTIKRKALLFVIR